MSGKLISDSNAAMLQCAVSCQVSRLRLWLWFVTRICGRFRASQLPFSLRNMPLLHGIWALRKACGNCAGLQLGCRSAYLKTCKGLAASRPCECRDEMMNSGPNRLLDELAKLMTDAAVRRRACGVRPRRRCRLSWNAWSTRWTWSSARNSRLFARWRSRRVRRMTHWPRGLQNSRKKARPPSRPPNPLRRPAAAKPAASKKGALEEGLTPGFAQFFLHRFSTGTAKLKKPFA
jgi:hypothetical protein